MNYKYLIAIAAVISLTAIRCSSGNKEAKENTESTESGGSNLMKEGEELSEGDNKGIGKFKDIQLGHPLDAKMIEGGKSVYDAKCTSCHKLSDEKLVGPGWRGVTDRRTPEWIMNFITNTSVMLDSDLIAQKLFVTCLVRMPSQGVKDDEARDLLEFMRQNDGKN